ncbi:RNA-binding (RRM/RBD/RNP motifs) family protein isoform X3 [Wolffia australiana]
MFVAAQAIVSTSSSSSAFASQTVASARFTKAFGAKEFPPASRIFIRNLSYATNEARLKNSFSDFGKIAEVQIPIDEATKKPKGFAFVQYYSQEEAVVALEQMDGKIMDGRILMVELAKPSRKKSSFYPITSGPPFQKSSSDTKKNK